MQPEMKSVTFVIICTIGYMLNSFQTTKIEIVNAKFQCLVENSLTLTFVCYLEIVVKMKINPAEYLILTFVS